MKPITIVLILACIVACNNKSDSPSNATPETSEPTTPANLDSLTWLIGNWQNPNANGHLQETWKKINDTLYSGESSLINGNDTSFYQTISLYQRGNNLYYVPISRGKEKNLPAKFRMTSFENHRVIFESNDAGIQQKVTYQLATGDSLFTEISGMIGNTPVVQKYKMKRQ